MSLISAALLFGAQVTPGLPVPVPPDLQGDERYAVCFWTFAAEAKEWRAAGRDTQEVDRVTGYYWAKVSGRFAGDALGIALDVARSKANPDLRPVCADMAGVDLEALRRTLAGKPLRD